ncbi:lysoplasmalogenase [Aliihoeflea aestuarii]|jgi:uncharacterized membrane protein YhhN|uniref:lysoplasmalogenase n=1 Tax=Aliihoeflea aestuarii TaxID=453840 RepID=UPI0020933FE6|nr:lysoplasmalogenase [Aliihoeflea aestuarii]MCO6389762.1 lysoplasmalogenase [Aliihoeflea aestuarii]
MLPFPGGIEAQANGALIISICAAILYLFARSHPTSWRRSAVKTAAVASLAWLSFVEGGPWLLTLGLTLSALGDLALAQEDNDRFFLVGLASFLGAHVAYTMQFIAGGEGLAILAGEPWRLAIATLLVAFGGFMLSRLWPALDGAMRPPVLAYLIAIVAMGIAAFTTREPALMVGAVLFIASDAILATERFLLPAESPRRAITGPAVWVTYTAAQLFIALGVLL